jgi:hypothetical protein
LAIEQRVNPHRVPLISGAQVGEQLRDLVFASIVNGPDAGKRRSLL